MNTLTLDIGNSKVKSVFWNDSEPFIHLVSPDLSRDELYDDIRKYGVNEVIFSTVRGNGNKVAEWLSGFPFENIMELTALEARDFTEKSSYDSHIGSDRIAAYYGAEVLYPSTSKLVIDLGTAITMDVIDKEGKFCGGDIVLGLKGRLNALNYSTATLPLVKKDDAIMPAPFGTNTKSAIYNGAINGIVGEILYAAKRAKKYFDIEKIIMTGGDAGIILPLVKEEGLECENDQFLVARGLNHYLRRNKIS